MRALTPTQVVSPTTAKKRGHQPSFFLCILPIDKCGPVWYNKRGRENRAGEERQDRISDL